MSGKSDMRPTPRQKPTKRAKTPARAVTKVSGAKATPARPASPTPSRPVGKAAAKPAGKLSARPAKKVSAKPVARTARRAADKPAATVMAKPTKRTSSTPVRTGRGSALGTSQSGARVTARGGSPRKTAAAGPLSAARQAGAGVAGAVGSLVRRGAPSGASGREQRQRGELLGGNAALVAARLAAVALVLALVAGVAYLVLRNSSAFAIASVEAEPTAHVTQEDIQNLVQVPAGSTLLNVDTAAIEDALRKDPWVASVDFELVFPDTLRLHINEQRIEALVVMSTGTLAWYLGDAGVWIQPTKITAAEGQSVNDAALQVAADEGCLLITDVPSTVDPVAGSVATDEVLASVELFREGFSSDFSSQIVSYSAPSTDNITCMLSSGVEISLGSATDIATKEQIAREILEEHPGQVTYINVRTPSRTGSSFRKISSDTVQSGAGLE